MPVIQSGEITESYSGTNGTRTIARHHPLRAPRRAREANGPSNRIQRTIINVSAQHSQRGSGGHYNYIGALLFLLSTNEQSSSARIDNYFNYFLSSTRTITPLRVGFRAQVNV